MTNKKKIRNIIELFIAWNGETELIDVANLDSAVDFIADSLQEEPVSEDLEDYAKKESESFAEREYEIDYIDRNALAKGYYWGIKAGAKWQRDK